MQSKNSSSSSRLLLSIILILMAGFVVLGISFYNWSLKPEDSSALKPWKVVSGTLERLTSSDGLYAISNQESLIVEHEGTRLEFKEGSKVRWDPNQVSILPEVLEGKVQVSTDSPFHLGGTDSSKDKLEPDGSVGFTITPKLIQLADGTLLWGDLVLQTGESFKLGNLPNAPKPIPSLPRGRKKTTPEVSAEVQLQQSGQLIDAHDGSVVSNASILVTWTHSLEGYPPLHRETGQTEIQSDGNGFFKVPARFNEDPRVHLHLQIEADGFIPQIVHLQPERDLERNWPFQMVELRRGLTTVIEFISVNENIDVYEDRLPVRIQGSEQDLFVGEDLWKHGIAFNPESNKLFYTNLKGELTVERRNLNIKMKHPDYFFWDDFIKEFISSASLTSKTLNSPFRAIQEASKVKMKRGIPVEVKLEDLDGIQLGNFLFSSTIAGFFTRNLNLLSDASGVLRFSRVPVEKNEENKGGKEMLLDLVSHNPLLWKVSKNAKIVPASNTILRFPKPIGGETLLKLLELPPDKNPQNATLAELPPRLHLRDDLTLVHRSVDGNYLYQGVYPERGSRIDLRVPGYLPFELMIPHELPPVDKRFELKPALLDRGESVTVQLIGESSDVQKARFYLSPEDLREADQVAHFVDSPTQTLHGLRKGEKYHYAIEGQRLIPLEGELFLSQEVLEKGLQVKIYPTQAREIFLEGTIVGLKKEEIPHHRVVERYYLRDKKKPVTFASYPLEPDGAFGSRRWLEDAIRSEVFIVGDEDNGTHLTLSPDPETGDFIVGKKVIGKLPTVLVNFMVDGVGKVRIPSEYKIYSEDNWGHEITRIQRKGISQLLIQNLLPGRYTFHWNSINSESSQPDTGEFQHTAHFEITENQLYELQFTRPANPTEEVLLTFKDSEGNPLEEELIQKIQHRNISMEQNTKRVHAKISKPLSPSLFLVPFTLGRDNNYNLHSNSLPEMLLEVPRGIALPSSITLPRSCIVVANVLDITGERFTGSIKITTTQIIEDESKPSKKDKGTPDRRKIQLSALPVSVDVIDGNLSQNGLISGFNHLQFEDNNSEAKFDLDFKLIPQRKNNVGLIRLKEQRILRGKVVDFEGHPVPGARVSVVLPKDAHRYPYRELSALDLKHAVVADGSGKFKIDVLPLMSYEDLWLIGEKSGHLYGFNGPLSLSDTLNNNEEHEIQLGEPTELFIDVGYRQNSNSSDDFQFELFYKEFENTQEELKLGSLAPQPFGQGSEFENIRPGIYGVRWSLQDPLPGYTPHEAQVVLAEGSRANLNLRLDLKLISGVATYNNQRLAKGWVILSSDPNDPDASQVGRVINGRFTIPAPTRTRRAYISLVKEHPNARLPRHVIGESAFKPIKDWRGVLSSGEVYARAEGHNLKINLGKQYTDPDSETEIELKHYYWDSRGNLKTEYQYIPIEGTPFELRDIKPGHFKFTIRKKGGATRTGQIDLEEDMEMDVF